MDGWIFLPPIHVFLSRGTFGRPSYQSENHHDSTNERSLKLRHRGGTNTQERGTRILFLCHSFKPTYGDDYCGDGADEHRATERESIHTIKPTVQGSRGYQDPSTSSCSSGDGDRDDRCMVRVFPSIRESRSTSELTRSRSAQAHTLIRGEFIGV